MANVKKTAAAKAAGGGDDADEMPRTSETATPNERQIRLKPYNPRAGHVLRRYTYRGIRFESEKNWYPVPLSVAEYLASVRNVADDPQSPLAFEVRTREQAEWIARKEFEEAVQGGRARPGQGPALVPRDTADQLRPGVDPPPVTQADLTTADLARRESYEPPPGRQTRPA